MVIHLLIPLFSAGVKIATSEYERKRREDDRRRECFEEMQERRMIEHAESQARIARYEVEISKSEAALKEIHEAFNDVFKVFAGLGKVLEGLGVVNKSKIGVARGIISKNLGGKDHVLYQTVKEMKALSDKSVIAGIVFCVACYPMHIYRGFGCGFLQNTDWGKTRHRQMVFDCIDFVLGTLKVHSSLLAVLTKVPVGMDQVDPIMGGREFISEESEKEAETYGKLHAEAFFDNKPPQPLDDRIRITKWQEPAAFWNSPFIYKAHSREQVSYWLQQMDPGRCLFAWCVWNRLDLAPDVLVDAGCRETVPLVRWLQGLRGMTHKVLEDDELDWKGFRMTEQHRQLILKLCGTEFPTNGLGGFVVRDPKYYAASTLSTSFPQEIPLASKAVETRRSEEAPPPYTTSDPIVDLAICSAPSIRRKPISTGREYGGREFSNRSRSENLQKPRSSLQSKNPSSIEPTSSSSSIPSASSSSHVPAANPGQASHTPRLVEVVTASMQLFPSGDSVEIGDIMEVDPKRQEFGGDCVFVKGIFDGIGGPRSGWIRKDHIQDYTW